MKQRVLLTLIMASLLGGMLLDRALVNAFGAEPLNWAGLIIGVVLNVCIARAAYVRVRATTMREETKL